ncbi:MAG: hypothetical protein JWM44_874 [Bacilli bacterium]|nr:hypothetical protein [Bacilli bacterium]
MKINQSEWLKELEKSYKIGMELGNETFDYKHYLVYFDGYGCYEFISREVIKGIDFI